MTDVNSEMRGMAPCRSMISLKRIFQSFTFIVLSHDEGEGQPLNQEDCPMIGLCGKRATQFTDDFVQKTRFSISNPNPWLCLTMNTHIFGDWDAPVVILAPDRYSRNERDCRTSKLHKSRVLRPGGTWNRRQCSAAFAGRSGRSSDQSSESAGTPTLTAKQSVK